MTQNLVSGCVVIDAAFTSNNVYSCRYNTRKQRTDGRQTARYGTGRAMHSVARQRRKWHYVFIVAD